MKQDGESYQDEVIKALCYLYHEALRESKTKIAEVLQTAIESCEKVSDDVEWSNDCKDLLKQFFVMREFQKLDALRKQVFVQEIENFQVNGDGKN